MTSDPLRNRRQESYQGALFLVFGWIIAFLALVSTVPWLLDRGYRPVFAGLGVLAALMLTIGAWLWRRSKRTDVAPLGARLHFWSTYAPGVVISGLMLLGRPSWPIALLFGASLALSSWFYLHSVWRQSAR